MNGLGIVVNALAIAAAGLLGTMVRGKLKVFYQKMILQVIGVAVVVMGALHAWRGLFVMEGVRFETTGTLLVLVALAMGLLFGEAMRVDLLVDKLGEWLRRLCERDTFAKGAEATAKGKGGAPTKGGKSPKASHAKGQRHTHKGNKDAIKLAKKAARAAERGESPAAAAEEAVAAGGPEISAAEAKPRRRKFSELPTYDLEETRTGHLFTDGFSLATLLCVFNALTFSGAIAAGTTGETELLLTKAAIDAVIVLSLSSIYGSGATLAAVPVCLVEGAMAAISAHKPELMTDTLTDHFVLVAAVMTMGAGLSLAFGKRWRVINMAPALLISPIYGLVVLLVEKFGEK